VSLPFDDCYLPGGMGATWVLMGGVKDMVIDLLYLFSLLNNRTTEAV
jgi:hypothetical protein